MLVASGRVKHRRIINYGCGQQFHPDTEAGRRAVATRKIPRESESSRRECDRAQILGLAGARLEFAAYCASIQVFDPTSLTATFEKKRCSGSPLRVPR